MYLNELCKKDFQLNDDYIRMLIHKGKNATDIRFIMNILENSGQLNCLNKELIEKEKKDYFQLYNVNDSKEKNTSFWNVIEPLYTQSIE